MGTTPKYAIPYVEPADLLANYPTQDKAQADRIEALLGTAPIMAMGVMTANYSPAANVDVPIGWGSFPVSHASLPWTGGAGRCDFTALVAGTYLFEATLKLERNTANPTARQQLMVWKNGATVFNVFQLSNPTTYESLSITRMLKLVVNDKVGLYYRVGATGATILGSGNDSSMTLTRVGP